MPSAIRHFVMAFLIAALIFAIVGALALGWFGKAVRNKEMNHITDDTINEDDNSGNDDPVSGDNRPMLRGQSFSLLLILNDYQPDRYNYGIPDNYTGIVQPKLKEAEALVYLRYSRETAKLQSAIIPTDTLITVDGVTMTAAEAYHYKDGAYLADKLSSQLGIRINYYCDAGFDEFVSFVNGTYMNGITLNLPEEIKVTLRSGTNVTLKEGNQYLDGERALALLQRDAIEDRELYNKVHLAFTHAMLEKLTTLENKMNPAAFYASVVAKFKTNLYENQLVSNTDMMFAYFDLTKETLTVPGKYDNDGNFIVNKKEASALFGVGTVLE